MVRLLIVLSFLQVACTNGEVVWCRCARPQRPRLPSIVAALGSGSRLSSCRMPVATRRASGGAVRADRAIETTPGASGSVSSPDPPSRRARVEPEGRTPISPSARRRDATGDDHDAQDATDAGGSGPRPHYTAPRPASTEPPGFKPAFKCPGWRLFGFALPPCLLLPRFLDLCICAGLMMLPPRSPHILQWTIRWPWTTSSSRIWWVLS